MRTVVLVLVLAGCAKPQPSQPIEEVVPVVVVPVDVDPVVEPPAEPKYGNPFNMSPHDTCETFKDDEHDLLTRALARGEVKAGDDIEPLIKRFPYYRVARYGVYTDLGFSGPESYLIVSAKNGKLVSAVTGGCILSGRFFDTTTPEDHRDSKRSYDAMMKQRAVVRDTFPALVGFPAAFHALRNSPLKWGVRRCWGHSWPQLFTISICRRSDVGTTAVCRRRCSGPSAAHIFMASHPSIATSICVVASSRHCGR